MSNPEEDKIVLSYHDTLLKQSDIDLLNGPHWLNDQLISFFFEYLTRNVYKDTQSLLFVSPEVTQCLKMVSPPEVEMFLSPLNALDRDLIFFALNNNSQHAAGGSHWSLLVWSRPVQTFFHFDSSTPSNHHVGEAMVAKLKDFLQCPSDMVPLKEAKCLQQANTYDCGIHVIAQAEFVAKHVTKSGDYKLDQVKIVPRLQVMHKREEILSLIETLAEEGEGEEDTVAQ